MKYKFIGTDKDLVENGFEKPFSQYGRYGTDYNAVFVDKDTNILSQMEFRGETPTTSSWYQVEIEVSRIQDLIDKGLVVEVE